MDDLRRLQLCEVDILLQLKRICDKYSLSYFLIGGTLLGAVRHQGFIPWDDDIDVGMPREDYEKFLEVAPLELGETYYLHNWFTDEGYFWPHSMIRINGTEIVHENSQYDDALSSKGIGIDIFVFDNMTRDIKRRKIQYYKAMCLKWLMIGKASCYENNDWPISKRTVYTVSKLIAHLFQRKKIIKAFNHNAQKYNNKSSGYIIDVGGLQGLNDYITYNNGGTVKELMFEGHLFKVPFDYDETLRRAYGDFMQQPPKEKQVLRHDIVHCNFGDYISKSSLDECDK